MARPSKLTPEIQEKIVRVIRAGNFAETAAAFAGVDESTFHRWMARGKRERKGPYREFFNAVTQARAGAEVRHVAIVSKAAEGDWRASEFWLSRMAPERWAKKEHAKIELTGKDGKPVEVEVEEKGDPKLELEMALERLIDRLKPPEQAG